jgi:tripartite-type tricarboxylate transporter receptor subunit TctC
VRVLATTGEARSKEFPNAPTMKESGVDDFVINGTWLGWFVPSGTPLRIVDNLRLEVTKALKNPQVIKAFRDGGFIPDGRTPAEFDRFVKAEYIRFGEVLSSIGITPQ